MNLFEKKNRWMVVVAVIFLAGCAASSMPGYQNVYKKYDVPEVLVTQIKNDFHRFGLMNASVKRDNTGRIQLAGNYKNDDEVDLAFSIVQSKVGLKSTSPFYPENVKEKTWEREINQALESKFTNENRTIEVSRKFALIIGIGRFKHGAEADSNNEKLLLDRRGSPRGSIPPLPGALDAEVAARAAEKSHYKVIKLIDQQATKQNIDRNIDELLAKLRPNDYLFVYISSHGLPTPDRANGTKMAVVAYDTNPSDVKSRMDSTVKDSKILALSKRPTKLTRMIIDTCYSGNIWQDKSAEAKSYISMVNNNSPDVKGIAPGRYATKGLFLSDGVSENSEIKVANSKFKNDSVVIMTATGPNGEQSMAGRVNENYAFEMMDGGKEKTMHGSFFTQAFFAYLDKYNGELEPAFYDAQKFTSGKVSELYRTEKGFPQKSQTPYMAPESTRNNKYAFN